MIVNRAIIHAGIGCGGNHIRWLLMLDPECFIFDGGVVSDKLGYILDQVYPTTRNPANWFDIELKYRQVLNQQIKFAHTDLDDGWETRHGQFDSKINYFSYPRDATILAPFHQMVVPNFNLDRFLTHSLYNRQQAEEYVKRFDGFLIDAEQLFSPALDQNLYSRICDFGKFTNCYAEAEVIHAAWWNARLRPLDNCTPAVSPLLCPYMLTEIT